MRSSFNYSDWPLSKLLILAWVILATLYFIYSQYTGIAGNVYKTAYTKGSGDAVSQLVQKSTSCQPVPVKVGDQTVSFINVGCLQQKKTDK